MAKGEANLNYKYRTRITSDKLLEGEKHQGNLEGATKQQLQGTIAPTLYARVAVTGNRNMGRRRNLMRMSPTETISHSSVQLNIHVDERTWLSNTWVGRLKKLAMFDRVEGEFMWNGREDITPKYLGDDMVLLMGLTDDRVEQLVREATDKGSSLFHLPEKWNSQMRT